MTRLLSKLLALAVASAFMLTAPNAIAGSSHMMHSSHMKHSCPAGQHWVKGYHTKSGKYVHGYCRK